jgi:hypothetical protein
VDLAESLAVSDLGDGSMQQCPQVYLHADMTIKEQALARVHQPGTSPGRYRPPDTLLTFLDNL